MRTLFSLLSLPLAAALLGAAELPFTATWESVPDWPNNINPQFNYPMSDGRIATLYEEIPGGNTNMRNYYLQIFDPVTQTLSVTPKILIDPQDGQISRLPLSDGRFVLIQGTMPTSIYSFADGTWSRTSSPAPDLSCSALTLEQTNGEVYVWGQRGRLAGYYFNPDTGVWRDAPGGDFDPQLTAFSTPPLVRPDLVAVAYQFIGKRSWIFDPEDASFEGLAYDDKGASGDFAWIGTNLGMKRDFHDGEERQYYISLVDVMGRKVVREWKMGDRLSRLASIDAAGRDWLAVVIHNPDNSKINTTVFDTDTSTWHDLPVLTGATANFKVEAYRTPNGLLVLGTNRDISTTPFTYEYKAWLLRVTDGSGPVPPRIADAIEPVVLDEGTSTTISYHLEGDIPPAGVTVVAERITGGSAPLTVVGGQTQLVRSRSEVKTVTLAALIDADGDDDTGTIRVRVVQGGGAIDPHARTISVAVTDIVTGDDGPGGNLPGDVNGDGVVNALDLDEVIDHFGTAADGQ